MGFTKTAKEIGDYCVGRGLASSTDDIVQRIEDIHKTLCIRHNHASPGQENELL